MIRQMLRIVLLAFLFLNACTGRQNLIASDQDATVIGGTEVQDGDVLAQSVVGLVNIRTNDLCAATLVSDRHAITAAHCLVREMADVRLYFAKDLNQRRLVERSISTIRLCPDFNPTSEKDPNCDVALVKFEGGLPEGYRPVELLQDSAPLTAQRLLTIVGFGMNDTDGWLGEGVLRIVRAPLLNPSFSPNEFLLDQRNGKGGCHGDSGAGIFLEQEGRLPLLAGVVNRQHDDPKSKCNRFAVGLNIPAVYNWLLLNLAEL